MPRTRPSELTISLTTRPQPPWRLTSRRNAVSVMPGHRRDAERGLDREGTDLHDGFEMS